jgi:hypothetical protein
MTEQELDIIANKVIERVLLRMPEVIGNLIREQALINKLNKKFYGKNPEFKDSLPLVVSILEKLETDNVGVEYEKLLEMATPIIKERIKDIKSCGVSTKPQFESLDLSADDIEPNGSF